MSESEFGITASEEELVEARHVQRKLGRVDDADAEKADREFVVETEVVH